MTSKQRLLRNSILLLLLVVIAAVAGKIVGRWRFDVRNQPEQRHEVSTVLDYSPTLVHVIEQLRASTGPILSYADENGKMTPPRPFIGGCSVGYAGRPGVFFLLIPYFEQMAQEHDLALMLNDKSPVVRVMAAHLILRGTNIWTHNFPRSSLSDDKEQVDVARGGCIIDSMTVAELVKRMSESPDYFGEHWYYQSLAEEAKKEDEANQALVPTPASVTPAAGAPVAPDAGAAHL